MAEALKDKLDVIAVVWCELSLERDRKSGREGQIYVLW